jgi:pimeloyl-ACP methyl ester carboxylesterase
MTTNYVLLHGGGQGSWVWQETIAALEAEGGPDLGAVLALDVPGCGTKRARDAAGMALDAVIDELVSDIVDAGLTDVVLVGHSQAGNVMPLMLAKRPALFRRLIYVACSAPLNGQTPIQMMGSGVHGSHPDEVGWPVDPATHSIEQRYSVMFCNDMSDAERTAFLAKLGRDAWPHASYLSADWRYDHLEAVASSYVVCLQDQCLPVTWQREFARRLKAQRLVHIDAGHQVMNTRPLKLAEVLRHEASRG